MGKQFLAAASGTTLVLYYRSYCHRDVLIFIQPHQRAPLPFLQEGLQWSAAGIESEAQHLEGIDICFSQEAWLSTKQLKRLS